MTRPNSDTPQPEDFLIGSLESRAAARALIESRDRDVPRLEIICDIPHAHREGQPDISISQYPDGKGGFVRIIRCSPETGEETIQRLLKTP